MLEKIGTRIKEKARTYLNLILVLVVLFFAFSLIRNLIKISDARKKIEGAKEKVEKLKKENEELEAKLKEGQSEFFVERQIRDKLGLAREGETILVLPDEETLKKLAPEIPEEEEALPDPTWKKWLKLFL